VLCVGGLAPATLEDLLTACDRVRDLLLLAALSILLTFIVFCKYDNQFGLQLFYPIMPPITILAMEFFLLLKNWCFLLALFSVPGTGDICTTVMCVVHLQVEGI
jgi:hypothetical protein